jgi:hypothetical protein
MLFVLSFGNASPVWNLASPKPSAAACEGGLRPGIRREERVLVLRAENVASNASADAGPATAAG